MFFFAFFTERLLELLLVALKLFGEGLQLLLERRPNRENGANDVEKQPRAASYVILLISLSRLLIGRIQAKGLTPLHGVVHVAQIQTEGCDVLLDRLGICAVPSKRVRIRI